MKILVLAPHPYCIDRGTPIDVDILLRALSGRGETVDVLTYREGEDRQYPNVTLHRIRAPEFLTPKRPGFSCRKLACDVYLVFEALALARRGRYDVVHAGEEAVFAAMLIKTFFGVPYIYDMDSSITQQMVEKMPWLGAFSKVLDWCERKAIQGSVAVAPVCNALGDLAKERGAKHVVTLHDISQLRDPDRPATGELRRRLGIEGVLLMYVGNLEHYQGPDLLLDAMAVAVRGGAKVALVVAGGAEEDIWKYRAKAEASGIGGSVHFLGPWPVAKLDELLAEADILTAPRIKGVNTPMKVFPYMHSGKPLLVTDLPTHSQVLDQNVARLAPPDPEGFGRAIVELASDPELRRRLGRAGRRFVEENHTFDAHVRRVNKLYDLVHSHVGRGEGTAAVKEMKSR